MPDIDFDQRPRGELAQPKVVDIKPCDEFLQSRSTGPKLLVSVAKMPIPTFVVGDALLLLPHQRGEGVMWEDIDFKRNTIVHANALRN